MRTAEYIEAILFMRGEAVKVKELSKILSISEEEVEEEITILKENLKERGVRLMRTEDSLLLSTAPEASEVLKSMNAEDLGSEVGKAGMEVLTIILYCSPVNRRHVDYIRGVNSSSTLRTLVLKGLIERNKVKASQSFIYTPSVDLLSFLGLTEVKDLPDYPTLRDKFLGILDTEN